MYDFNSSMLVSVSFIFFLLSDKYIIKKAVNQYKISYKLRFPFNEFINVTNPDDDKPLLYEPIESLEGIGIEANDNENIQSGYMQSCEPKIMQKKQEVALKNATSLQIGCALWTVTQLLQQHHAEVISRIQKDS